jgi:hypothetical protein
VVLFLCADIQAQETTTRESISLLPIAVKSRKKTENGVRSRKKTVRSRKREKKISRKTRGSRCV